MGGGAYALTRGEDEAEPVADAEADRYLCQECWTQTGRADTCPGCGSTDLEPWESG